MKTMLHNKGRDSISEVGWDADYDGELAHISLGINENGKVGQYQFQLDNQDLEQLLSIPSVNQSLDQRLTRDFTKKKTPMFIVVEEPHTKNKVVEPFSSIKNTHLSSPTFSEELMVPLTIQNKKTRRNTYRSSRRRNKPGTYRVYKIPKRSKNSRSSSGRY
jgi:hypothetical protein